MRTTTFEFKVVHRVPEVILPDTLYACFDCNVVVHSCACGCGEKVVLPIDPEFWKVEYNGEVISMHPSIGNFQYACKSHYWIRGNRVIWADKYPLTSIEPQQVTKSKKLPMLTRIKKLLHLDRKN